MAIYPSGNNNPGSRPYPNPRLKWDNLEIYLTHGFLARARSERLQEEQGEKKDEFKHHKLDCLNFIAVNHAHLIQDQKKKVGFLDQLENTLRQVDFDCLILERKGAANGEMYIAQKIAEEKGANIICPEPSLQEQLRFINDGSSTPKQILTWFLLRGAFFHENKDDGTKEIQFARTKQYLKDQCGVITDTVTFNEFIAETNGLLATDLPKNLSEISDEQFRVLNNLAAPVGQLYTNKLSEKVNNLRERNLVKEIYKQVSNQKMAFGKWPKKPLVVYGEGHYHVNSSAIETIDSWFSRKPS